MKANVKKGVTRKEQPKNKRDKRLVSWWSVFPFIERLLYCLRVTVMMDLIISVLYWLRFDSNHKTNRSGIGQCQCQTLLVCCPYLLHIWPNGDGRN